MNSFLKLSLRHLWKSRLYAVINIIGLAVAVSCVLLAVIYWNDERSYDNFHQNNPHLYRILTNITSKENSVLTIGGVGQVQGPAFKAAVPEVKTYARVFGGDIYSDVSAGTKTLHVQPLFVDKNFFDLFSFKLLSGDPSKVLDQINSVVISESTAKKFFNNIDAVGKVLKMDADPSYEKLGGRPLIISGVVKDPPANSSLQFDLLFTFDFLHLSFHDENWLNAYMGTFLVLHPGATPGVVEEKFNKIYRSHAKKQVEDNNFNIYGYDPKITYTLQPVTEIHLHPYMTPFGNAEAGINNGSDPLYSYMFMGIALFILLMAAINFININIASSLQRSKEVGIRKISGSSRRQIIIQFLYESALLCFIAFLLSLVTINTVLPLFNQLTEKNIRFSEALDFKLLLYFIAVFLFMIACTGVYPAIIVSRFKPAQVLYNKQKLSGRNLFGRGLVVIQFALALFLLTATIVYYSQMDYIRTKDLGYNPNQVIRTNIGGDRDYKSVINFLKNELAKEPSITGITFGNDGYPEDIKTNNRSFRAEYKNIDENFIAVLGVKLKEGRNISTPSSGTGNSILVNEAFLKAASIENPLGTQVEINRYGDSTVKTIKGVIKDFHNGPLREVIKPMVLYANETPDGGVWIKFDRLKQKEAMAAVERSYKKAMPGAVYQFNFLDELNAREYREEQRWQKIITIATLLCFIICCLGLFGLAHLSTSRRVKEIGVRKVLGASAGQIVVLLSGSFLQLILIAFIIAVPVAWVVMNNWLQNFAYRINISWWVFIESGSLMIVIALATISYQSVKAALANPVDSLRTE